LPSPMMSARWTLAAHSTLVNLNHFLVQFA
jgi:hypothetical protein